MCLACVVKDQLMACQNGGAGGTTTLFIFIVLDNRAINDGHDSAFCERFGRGVPLFLFVTW